MQLLPWDQPLLTQAVDMLAGDWKGDGPLDLSGRLVIVPTRQSGRRLREALAAHAHRHGQAVFSPLVVPPEAITTLGEPGAGLASRLTSLLAWIMVFRTLPLDEFRAVFPIDPPVRDFAWASRLADQFMHLQASLAEVGLRMGGVNAHVGQDFPETGRWIQLALLEQRYDDALAARNLRDEQAAKIVFASSPAFPAGITKIIMLGTPDPLPLATQALARLAEQVPVEIVMCGPADNPVETMFDEWGRPRTEYWAQREIDWPDFEQRVCLTPDPAEQAEQIVALAQSYPEPEGMLAIGVADAEVLAPLENGLQRAEVPVFNPEGRLRRRDEMYALLVLLADFVRTDEFPVVAGLLRCPVVMDWLGRQYGPKFSRAILLTELDGLHASHLPSTLGAARQHAERFPMVSEAMAALADLRTRLTVGEFPANALDVLTDLLQVRRAEPDSPLVESAEAWRRVTTEISQALAAFPGLTLTEKWELALAEFAGDKYTAGKPVGALELNGWLELLWEDAPHLVVAGLNDGRVPTAVVGDAFLPETLRDRLGLKTNASRLARDAYLLAAMRAMRTTTGRLDVLLGRVSASGDPLRPSRLLFRCADMELPRRISFLFRNVETVRASLPWTRAWPLRPRVVPPPAKLSVTALRDYLACPFRFYLKQVLRMEPVDPAKTELDARDFGTLLHSALQAMGEDDKLRNCADEAVLRNALLAVFERDVRQRYGGELTLPLVVQFESARQRLRAAAAVQAREVAAGWRIERVEWGFEFNLGGLKIRGKIDRLDRHVDGRVRVLDYKSSDTSVDPETAHLGPVAAEGETPAWARVKLGGKERAWLDLQLPLYRCAVAPEFGTAVECGYFNLPKAASETMVNLWDGPAPELQAAAEECARHIAEAVVAATFWPPAELNPQQDETWAGLLHHGAAASVVAGWALGGAR